jgi:hypothetical protein
VGGYDSGEWRSSRYATVEDCRVLDTAWLHALRGGIDGLRQGDVHRLRIVARDATLVGAEQSASAAASRGATRDACGRDPGQERTGQVRTSGRACSAPAARYHAAG